MNVSTDNSLSIAAHEFVWTDSHVPGAHAYLVPPMIKALRNANASTVLDLGCGNGACAALMQSHGFAVTGCDVSRSGIELARRSHPNLEFIEHDISRPLPAEFAGHYDAVVSLEVVEHLLQPRHLVTSAYKALRPGGLLILSTPFHGYWKNLALAITDSFDEHWHPLRDFGHVKFFSKKTLIPLVREAGFSFERLIHVGRISAFACSMIVLATKPE